MQYSDNNRRVARSPIEPLCLLLPSWINKKAEVHVNLEKNISGMAIYAYMSNINCMNMAGLKLVISECMPWWATLKGLSAVILCTKVLVSGLFARERIAVTMTRFSDELFQGRSRICSASLIKLHGCNTWPYYKAFTCTTCGKKISWIYDQIRRILELWQNFSYNLNLSCLSKLANFWWSYASARHWHVKSLEISDVSIRTSKLGSNGQEGLECR